MTNYDILKEYEAHKEPLPSYEEWVKTKELLKEIERDARDPTKHQSLMNAYINIWLKIHKFLFLNGELKEIYK